MDQTIWGIIIVFSLTLIALHILTFRRATKRLFVWADSKQEAKRAQRFAIMTTDVNTRARYELRAQYFMGEAAYKWLFFACELLILLVGVLAVPGFTLDLNQWLPTILVLSLGAIAVNCIFP